MYRFLDDVWSFQMRSLTLKMEGNEQVTVLRMKFVSALLAHVCYAMHTPSFPFLQIACRHPDARRQTEQECTSSS